MAAIGDLLAGAEKLARAVISVDVRPGSQAEKDFNADIFPRLTAAGVLARPWPRSLLVMPRGLAVNLMLQASEMVHSMGLAYQNGLLYVAPFSAGRSAFEYIARAMWVLDAKVDHRIRCARQLLMDLKTWDELRKAAKPGVLPSEQKVWSRQKSKERKSNLDKYAVLFGDRIGDDGKPALEVVPEKSPDAGFPILAGERNLGWSELAEFLADRVGLTISGEALYAVMCMLGPHPQGWPALSHLLVSNGDGSASLKVNLRNLEKIAGLTALLYYEAVESVASYHGPVHSSDLDAWFQQLEQLELDVTYKRESRSPLWTPGQTL